MTKTVTTKENLEDRFDVGEDVLDYFDVDNPSFPNRELKRVNVDFPLWMVNGLDDEASRLGVNRQAVIKIWVSQKLDSQRARVYA